MKISLVSIALVLVLLTGVSADELVWQIGAKDNGYSELAIPGNHMAYPKLFSKGVSYRVEASDPKSDWPYVQPGPADAWTNGAGIERRIEFEITGEPASMYVLEIDAVDCHPFFAPTVSVAVNGREEEFTFAGGVGDPSLGDASKGREQCVKFYVDGRYLREGANTVSIKTSDGSWLLYDAVSLSTSTGPRPHIEQLTLQPTCLFKRDGKNLRQIVRASVEVYSDTDQIRLHLRSEQDWQVERVHRGVLAGRRFFEIDIPPVKTAQKVHVRARVRDEVLEAECVVEPAKQWKVYLLPSTHFDLGYTGPQEDVLALHRGNMDRALDWTQRYSGFVWNLEGSYLAEDYLKRGKKPKEFIEAARKGAIGIQAFFGNELTGICSSEGLDRLLDYYDYLRKVHGIASNCAMQTDVPTMVATVPMMLRGHGIRYLSHGINATRARGDQEMQNTPHWWQSPDGSKVLMWKTGGYGLVSQIVGAGDTGSVRVAEQRLKSMLDGYANRSDYPFDAILLHGGYADNVPNGESMPQVVADWNQTYAYPKLIFCRGSEFFEYIERNFAKDLKTVKGDGGVWWEDGAASSAYESAITRRAKYRLLEAEKLTALCDDAFQKEIKAEFGDAWRNVLLYDEHTWGAAQSISEPDSKGTAEQWEVKKAFADKADELSRSLLNQATDRYRANLRRAHGLPEASEPKWSFGPSSDTRTRLHSSTGTLVPLPTWEDAPGPSIENSYYRITFDPSKAAIKSIYDKQLKRELVDSSLYGANGFLYVTGGGGSVEGMGQPKTDLKIETCRVNSLSPSPNELSFSGTWSGGKMSTRVVLHDDEKRIDFINEIEKTPTTAKEAGYFAFPFAFTKPEIRLEIPNGIIKADTDQFKAACRDWFAVQDFLTVSDGKAEVVLVPWDSPLVTLQDINRGQWYDRLAIENGNVFAYVFNNYWFTNYKASQGGPLTFRFSMTSGKSLRDSDARRFADSVLLPSPVKPATVDAGNVVVQAIKPARFANGTVVRLREMDGKSSNARLAVTQIPFRKAYLCNLAEDKIRVLKITKGVVEVPCPALGLATVLLER